MLTGKWPHEVEIIRMNTVDKSHETMWHSAANEREWRIVWQHVIKDNSGEIDYE